MKEKCLQASCFSRKTILAMKMKEGDSFESNATWRELKATEIY